MPKIIFNVTIMLLPYFYNICIPLKMPSYNTSKVQKHVPLCALVSSNPNFHFTGKWYFDDCGKKGYGFVCEKMQGKKQFGFYSFYFQLSFHSCCLSALS